MLFFLVIYFLLCLWGIKFHKQQNKDYLSIQQTTSIKGLFILLVFLSHFTQYAAFEGKWDSYYITFIYFFGQTMVTLFLFYSGYGVMESIKRKGASYIDSIPGKRVVSTLIRFDCAVVLFLLLGCITENSFGFKQVILSFIGWENLGNSNWYIFVILLLYLITYVAFKLIKNNTYIPQLVLVLLAVLGWIYFCAFTNVKTFNWYDTALCYVFGMAYSAFREKVEKMIHYNNIVWGGVLILSTVIFFVFKGIGTIKSLLIVNLVFAFLVVLITMHISIGNKVLEWCGRYLFELYILQRIPMILLQYIGLDKVNIYVYFVCCVAGTLLLVKPFEYVCNKVLNLGCFKRMKNV